MEELYDKNADEEKTRRKRRSSILKTPKSRDPFSEIEPSVDITLSKSVRRVSFASSNFVKPFVADPIKNTIWDTTYEEEVNHTNSTQSSQEQMSTKLNSTFLHSIHNLSNVTNFETSEMDITKLIGDKENILQVPPVISIIDYAKQLSSNSVVPLYDITTQNNMKMNVTQTEAPTMELTCQYFTPYLQETEPADESSEMELTEISLSEESEQSITPKRKQTLHCDTENIVLSKIDYSSSISSAKTDNIRLMSVSKTRHDMNLTYQNPNFNKTLFGHGQMSKRDPSQIPSRQDFHEDQIMCMSKTHSKVDMEFTCQIPAGTVLESGKSMNDMELTRQLPEKLSKSRKLSNTENTFTSDREFTCQIPADRVLVSDKSMSDMELTCQIPKKLSKSRKLSNTEKTLTSDMEFTCQIPADALKADKFMSDMELTRQIPEKLSKSRKLSNTEKTLTLDMEFTCQIPADRVLEADKSMSNMELTCQIPKKLSNSRKLSNTEKTLTSDMEFTCQIPADRVLEADKSMSDMELTRQIPEKLSKSRKLSNTEKTLTSDMEANKSMNDMELTRQIPEKLSRSRKSSKTEKTLSSDMEFTCQIQNKSENRMELTCQIPADKTLKVGKTRNDMEFTCHISDNQSKSRKSDMEFTCQYLTPFLQKNEQVDVSEMELTEISLSPQTEKSEQAIMSKTEHCSHHDKENIGILPKSVETCQVPLPKTLHDSEISFGFCQVPKIDCQILASTRQDLDKDHTTCLPKTPPNEDMKLTCQLSDKTLKADKSMNDMEFTRQIPGNLSKSRNLSRTEKRSTSDIQNTCQISKTETVDNVEFTRRIKDTNELSSVENKDITGEMSKVHSLSKTLTNVENSCQIRENREVSCQKFPKLQTNHEISCHDMNETEYMEISYGDLQMTGTKSIELGCQISQEQVLSKTENMNVNQTEISMENMTSEIVKTKTVDKLTNVPKIPTEHSPQDSKNTLTILDRKGMNQSNNDKVVGTPKAERTFVNKHVSQTTPKSPFNTSKIPVRSPSWMKIDTPSKKNRYLSVNKKGSQLDLTCGDRQKTDCDDKNDILFSQKMPNLTSNKNSFYLYKTPEPSFRINSPINTTSGVDDTQLLLHCTYNKTYPSFTPSIENEVSCYKSFSLKEMENISKPNLSNISNMNISDTDCVLRNVSSRSSSDTSSIDFQSNKLATVNDTYVLKGKKTNKHVTYVDDFMNDENIELSNETLIFPSIDESPLIQNNCLEVKLQEFNVEIGNKWASNNLAVRMEKQRMKTIDFMKRFKFKAIHIPKELTFTGKRSEGELPSQKNKGDENVPSIEDKVKEHQIRCQNSWKLEKIDGDFYHFSTLSDAVVFTAQIDPSDGKVHNLQITNKLTDNAHPIYRYTIKQFLYKLEDNHVKAAIGKQHDLLSLLDYVQMVTMQLKSLLRDLIKCDLTIDSDCMASFSFFNEILGLYFIVSVDVTDLENINYNSVEITQKIGSVSEHELKNYLKNGPKGWSFFKEFSQAIKDFLTIKEKRKRF